MTERLPASEQGTIRWDADAAGVVTLTLDDPERSANTMNERHVRSMEAALDRLEREKDGITGVVITSAKTSFFAGADLDELIQATPADAERVSSRVTRVKAQLRRLETLGRPIVAAVNGAALGGGFEIALACHYRLALNDPELRVGLPEVTLGQLPGGGGVVRTVRLLGISDAMTKVLGEGQRLRPRKAAELGLVHEVVDTRQEMFDRAREWIAANPDAAAPWDRPGYRIPGGTPASRSLAQMLPAFPANLRKQLKGADYPAPRNILAAAVEGTQVDFDTAMEIESRYFVATACGQTATNMSQAFFFDLQHVNGGGSRPAGYDSARSTRLGVLGAGMMGAGIAYVCARSGMHVVLKDVTLDAARRGLEHSVRLLDEAVAKGRSTREAADEVLARITPSERSYDLADCDLVIEAVFEDPGVKRTVFAEAESAVAAGALLASNTSTLPITALAEGVERQEDFIGLHFFSPVHKMPLVEIIRGRRTSDAALAKAFDVVRQIGKTPIVVNDSRGFFTSRVIGTFLMEGVALLAEGVNPVSIEQASAQAGYPAPVLQLLDELTLTLSRTVRDETRKALETQGLPLPDHPADPVIDRMVEDFGRGGRSSGAGFYDYADGRRTRLWPGLYEHFIRPGADVPFADMQERMLFVEALEAVKCLDEGVITSVPDANIGSIFGIGYPAWTGGVAQYVQQYPGGPAGFAARARELARRYGDRFTPPESLAGAAPRPEAAAV